MSELKNALDGIWNRPGVRHANHFTKWIIYPSIRWGLWFHLPYPFYVVGIKGKKCYRKIYHTLGRSACAWYPRGFWATYNGQHHWAVKTGAFNGQDEQG